MKALRFHFAPKLAHILSWLLPFSLVSCAGYLTLTSPIQISQLPISHGSNGGSLVAETPWQYRGSRGNTHQFYYYYHTDNLLRHREVSIPRAAAVLHFHEAMPGSETRWVTLQSDSKLFYFYPYPSPHR